MLPISTALTTGTRSFHFWSASGLGSNLRPPCRLPTPTQTMIQVIQSFPHILSVNAPQDTLECGLILCNPFVPGAQSDSELSSYHQSEVSLDRGYTSDSEVYTEHGKSRIPRSATDVDVGWLVVSVHTIPQRGSLFETDPALRSSFG